MLSIGDFAKKTGLTVRALRFYEEKGLISPPRSRDNDRRYYGAAELREVQKIVSLKQLGFPLSEIEHLIKGRKASLPQVLIAQLETLKVEKSEVENAIKALKLAIATLSEGNDLDIQTLTKLIRMTTMTEKINKDLRPVYEKHFSKDQLEEFDNRKLSPQQINEYNAAWKKHLGVAKTLLGTDPSAPEAQALVDQTKKMIEMFTGGNPGAEAGLHSMYGEVDEWGGKHAEAMFGMSLEDFKKVQKFIHDAQMAGKKG
ncbi:MAG: MerR family transcriptional regulator [Sphingomonadales bacterium]